MAMTAKKVAALATAGLAVGAGVAPAVQAALPNTAELSIVGEANAAPALPLVTHEFRAFDPAFASFLESPEVTALLAEAPSAREALRLLILSGSAQTVSSDLVRRGQLEVRLASEATRAAAMQALAEFESLDGDINTSVKGYLTRSAFRFLAIGTIAYGSAQAASDCGPNIQCQDFHVMESRKAIEDLLEDQAKDSPDKL